VSRTLSIITNTFLVFLAIAVLGGMLWGNAVYSRQNPGGKDFLVPWSAARSFLEFSANPYEDPATERTQILYYGRLAAEDEDPLRLALPFPVLLLYFPTAIFFKDFYLARGIWMLFLEAALVASAFLGIGLVKWKPPRLVLIAILLAAVFWLPAFLSLAAGSAVIFSSASLLASLAAMRAGRDELAGACLALASFSVRATGLFLFFLLGWIIARRRWRILGGTGMVYGFLTLLSFLLLPSWFLPFIRAAYASLRLGFGDTPASFLMQWLPGIGLQLSWALTGILLLALLMEWRAARTGDDLRLSWTISLTLAVSLLIGAPVDPFGRYMLFLPVTTFISVVFERWAGPHRWLGVAVAYVFLLLAGWVAVTGLGRFLEEFSLQAILFFTLPSALIAGLYWVRWWALHPPRVWADQARDK